MRRQHAICRIALIDFRCVLYVFSLFFYRPVIIAPASNGLPGQLMSDVAVARFNISTLSVQILLLGIFSELISGTQRTLDTGTKWQQM